MFKKPFIPIQVYKWNSDTVKEEFIFDADSVGKNVINETIYQDFTVEDAVNRIGLYLLNHLKKNTEPFYAWVHDRPLMFSLKDIKWEGYNVNPFKSSNHKSTQLNEPVSYQYHTNELFTWNTINIVFASDLPKDLIKNKYYFSDIKIQTYKQYKKHDDKLTYLKGLNVETKNIKITGEYFSRLNYHTQLKNVLLAELFDTMHTSKYVDMIQWIDDPSRVLYKLFKNHKIKKEWMTSWINIDKITKINVLNIYSVINKYGYCKISIDNNGSMIVNYIFDIRSFTKISDLNHHKKELINILQNHIKQSIKLQDLSLNANVRFEIHNSSFKQLAKKIGENIDIFHIVKTDSNKNKISITCTYKRCSNYSQTTDIYDYIQSRINIGISRQEIAEELINLGVTGNIDEMIQGELQQQTDSKINLQNNGTILIIEPYSQGYNISIINCPKYNEMQYMLYWLSKIMVNTIVANTRQVVPEIVPIAEKLSSSSSPSSSSMSSIEKESIDWDIDSLGGGIGKAKYLIDMLQEADKELFGENYARDKCQNPSQPIVLTQTQLEQLQNNNQAHFDNVIKYGSNPNLQNYYACPRLWCPESKVSLSVDDINAKCPLENEKPIEMFWNKDKTKKRFVKLIKPNEKGMCVPCCMKKEPKQDEINKCQVFLKKNDKSLQKDTQEQKNIETIHDTNDEHYIMNQVSPIPSGRYGNIPEILHNILFHGKNVKPEMCSKTIQKSQPCFVRKGIKNNRYDSIVLTICNLLGFKTKQAFIRDIADKLDILTFVSLDNGNVCKNFMSINEIIPENSKKLMKSYQAFVKNNPNLATLNMTNVSRTLNVYYAYKRFINYIAANDFHTEKLPEYMHSLIMTLYNVTILLWNKTDNGTIDLDCPQRTYINVDFNPDVCMIIKEGRYYEPIIYKIRNIKEAQSKFKLNEYPKLKELLGNCQNTTNMQIYKNIYSLNNWVKSNILKDTKKFIIKKIIIHDDLSINKMMTSGNILLSFQEIPLSLLPVLLHDLRLTHQNVVFYADICDKKYDLNLKKTDVALFSEKCHQYNIDFDAGKLKANGDIGDIYYTTLTLKQDLLQIQNKLIIHTNNLTNEYYTYLSNIQNSSKVWFDLHKMIVKNIIKKYSNTEFEELRVLSRKERVNKLMNLFDNNIPHKRKIRIILEELPIDNLDSLKKWLSNIIIITKYDFLSNGVQSYHNEFVFSQNAFISNGMKKIPQNISAFHNALPSFIKTTESTIKNIDIHTTDITESNSSLQPLAMLQGTMQKLSSKWMQHKKSKWFNMVYIKTEYSKELFINLIDWLSQTLGIKITYQDILMTTRQKFYDILDDKEAMIELLQDQSYFLNWLQVVNRKYPTVLTFWENVYEGLSSEQRKTYLTKILENDKMYPNDFHLDSISKLFNISILTLHRGKYGKFDVQDARGGLKDLVLSSTLYAAKNNMASRPILIFNKINEKQYSGYYLVVEKNTSNVYMKYSEIPDNVKLLVEAHMADS